MEIGKAYDKAGADELVFLDITATSDARGTVVDMVRKVAETVFIPFTVGGESVRSRISRCCSGKEQIRFLSIFSHQYSKAYLGRGRQVRQPVRGGGDRCQEKTR